MKIRNQAILSALLLAATSTSYSAIVLSEPFTYPDGALVGAAGSPWTTHSGAAPGQVNISGNLVNLTSTETEDVNAPLTGSGSFFNSGTLTATFNVQFSALPTAAGSYFTHFKDATAIGFRGRVFALTTGAASGSFRFGIADTTTPVTTIPTDLSLNTLYSLTLTLDVASGRSSLAVNGGTAVSATDTTTPLAISTYALRQNIGMGTFTMDNLVVDASMAAVPEPSAALAMLSGAAILVARRRRRA